jgi:DNA-binding CsgD family transcriptional regulator
VNTRVSIGIEHALRERVKELSCLYGVARLAEQGAGSVGSFLQGVVELLPPAWQYPEVTRAAIIYRGHRFESHAAAGPEVAVQTAPIRVADEGVGEIRVMYVERCPDAFEGPFLREERALVDGLAEYVATITRRIEAESLLVESNRLLQLEREALRESNVALRTVLARIGDERQELHRDLHANVEKVLLPVIQAISMELSPQKRAYATLLRSSLLDITSPLTRGLARLAPPLTPAETSICSMIRNGLRTKEIARLRGISAMTVNRHREHIRRKLGLANQAVNLTTWLQNQGVEPA